VDDTAQGVGFLLIAASVVVVGYVMVNITIGYFVEPPLMGAPSASRPSLSFSLWSFGAGSGGRWACCFRSP
jgi:predicted PurR-regulated permease PerM